MIQGASPLPARIVVWDWPVRFVHWTVAALLPLLWWTAENGEMAWHKRLGLAMLGLLAFRLLWGLAGSETARFRSFVRGPRAVLHYLRQPRQPIAQPGHSPIGGWSVVLLLALLVTQVALGLVAGDPDDGAVGPLNGLVSYGTARLATEAHEILFNVLVAFACLHVAAVAFYLVARRNDLVTPMITGQRTCPPGVDQPDLAPPTRLLACAIAAGALAWWLGNGAPA